MKPRPIERVSLDVLPVSRKLTGFFMPTQHPREMAKASSLRELGRQPVQEDPGCRSHGMRSRTDGKGKPRAIIPS